MEDLCALLVTFHPEAATLRNIDLLAAQVKELVVIDNGSSAAAVEMLRDAASCRKFTLIEIACNSGIAAALNLGVKHAFIHGHRWMIFFDQDSTVTPGFIEAMVDGYRKHPRRDSVGIFCPHYVDRVTGLALPTSAVDSDGNPAVAMTSGSLMPAWVFERCGWFMEELFIDQVDVEYCFRIRSSGYTIARCQDARLLHSAGSPRVHGGWTARPFRATHHNARRRYYITRNRMWVAKAFWNLHRDWCIPILRSIVADTIKLLLVEDFKVAKLHNTFVGIRDAFKGRLGKTLEL